MVQPVSLSSKISRLNTYLEEKGLKRTLQREIITKIFLSSDTHIGLDNILIKARRKNPKIGSTTVYRTMKLLVDCGLATPRQFGDGRTQYENLPEDDHHDHIICLKCSRIEEFHNQQIEDLQLKMADSLGFKVLTHKLEIYGYCSACR